MKHSPLPWTNADDDGTIGSTICDANGCVLLIAGESANTPYELDDANASFAVVAVNNHARLVEALEKIERFLEICPSGCQECGGAQIAREALAALKDAGR